MSPAIWRSALITVTRLVTGARPVWRGCTPWAERPRVYFANHGSHLDFVALWAALPPAVRERTRPVAARDFWSRGRLRPWVSEHIFRALLINRETVTRADNPLVPMLAALADGESLILFPEGTRSRHGVVRSFKAGLYHVARRCPTAELIPVHLQNLNRVLPRGEYLPVPLLSTIVFGAPIQLEPGEAKLTFLTRAREAVLALEEAS